MRRGIFLSLLTGGLLFAGSAHARNFFNCPIYPLPPAPKAPPEKKVDKAPPRQKSFEETFQQTQGTPGSSSAPITNAVVTWQPYYDEAAKGAKDNDRPFVLFFCDSETAKLAGEGPDVRDKYKKSGGMAPPPTIFDSVVTLKAFQAAGVIEFFKVPNSADNASLYKQYEATNNMLVFCSPDGDRLAVFPAANLTQTNVVHFLENGLAAYMTEWRKDVKAEAERVAAETKTKADNEARVTAIRARKAAESQSKGRSSDAAVKQTIAAIDSHMAKLEECQNAGWTILKDKDKKEVHPIKEANALLNVITDLGEGEDISDQPPSLLEQMVDAQTRATAFVGALKDWARAGTPESGVENVNNEFKRLQTTITKVKSKK